MNVAGKKEQGQKLSSVFYRFTSILERYEKDSKELQDLSKKQADLLNQIRDLEAIIMREMVSHGISVLQEEAYSDNVWMVEGDRLVKRRITYASSIDIESADTAGETPAETPE